jgi:glycosyltransferase involved in cell wall biosynthesis
MSMGKIRVALCITDLEVGGAERSLVELATHIDRARFEPVVYSIAPRPKAGRDLLVARLDEATIPVRFLDAPRRWLLPIAWRRLRGLLLAQEPHVVQTFLFHANILGRLAAWSHGVGPVVSGIRVAERGSPWHLWVDRWTQGLVARNVCVSQAVAQFSIVQGRLPPDKLVVIPNSVDATRFTNLRPADLRLLGVPEGREVVIYVGRLQRQKGLRGLIASASGWLGRLAGHDLLLLGEGPEGPALRRQCRELGIAGRVHFAGWRADVPALLAGSRLLVLPSLWEGMPNVVLEAMASGLPVVAMDVEGVRELLGDAAEEQVVQPGNWQGFAAKIIALAEDRGRAAELSAANRCRAIDAFSPQRSVQAYEDLWTSLATCP